jgi:hypothetical protein
MNRIVTKLTQSSPHVNFPTSKLEETYKPKKYLQKNERGKAPCLSATTILWGLTENLEMGGLEMDLGVR